MKESPDSVFMFPKRISAYVFVNVVRLFEIKGK